MGRVIFSILALIFFIQIAKSQISCDAVNSTFNFNPSPFSQNKFINWDSFPEFSLPFKIVYNGPRFGDNKQQPLIHGFTHLSQYSGADSANLPVKNRALIYYGVAYIFPRPQPWQTIRSPWGNDMADYQAKWRGEMAAYASHFNDTRGTRSPAADMLILDIERHWEGEFQSASDKSILAIKNDPKVPKEYSQLTDAQFIAKYKSDMLKLYSEPLTFMKNDNLLSKFNSFSSYGDVPIRFQGLNIEANQWADWQTNPIRLSYLMKDATTNNLGGAFYNQMDFLCPSVYVQADYSANPKTRGGNYLSEMLFQIEVNRAWSKKDILPFVWLRYEDFSLQYPRWIKPYQAEAMAIFPFMAGAKGAVLWEDSFDPIDINYSTYEHYINGLYRLSLYKSFFEGNHEFVYAENARDLNTKQLPVWRGVVKNSKILIAAQNPYASENEITKLVVTHNKWTNTINLIGRNVFLCSFNLADITSNEPLAEAFDFKVLGNPISLNSVKFSLNLPQKEDFEIFIINSKGNTIYKEKKSGLQGEKEYVCTLNESNKGILLLKLKFKNETITKKISN